MKAVLDVGQFVSATINPRGHPAQILTAWRNDAFTLVTSSPILEDLRRVLFYPLSWLPVSSVRAISRPQPEDGCISEL
jgi:predicted nucleic acid-binding protein